MSKPTNSGTASRRETTHIIVISVAVQTETPPPFIPYQDTTARYLQNQWQILMVFFFFFFISVTMRHFKCLGSTILWHGDEIEIGVCKYYFLFSGHRTTVLISLPVNTQSTQTQHSNSNRGFLYEGHKFAQHKTKWPIFCYELQKQTNIKKKQGHYHKQRREQTIFEK